MTQAQTQRKTPLFDLVVFDMAGTTVRDDGIVEQAFQRAAERTGIAEGRPWSEALTYVRDTMGQSKIDVFTHLASGDRERAAEASIAFEVAYDEIVAKQGAEEIPGAAHTITALREAGCKVVLTTGFAPPTRNAIIESLGWGGLVDLALSPVDVGRGRPAPDLVLAALLRTRGYSMDRVAVFGDTTSDMQSGCRAGAGLVVGVLSGAHTADALLEAGADAVIPDVTALPQLPEFAGLDLAHARGGFTLQGV